MSIFEQLNNYWIEKGPAEAHMSMFRENEKDTKHLYKDVSEEAKLAAKDDGHEEGTDAFTAIVERIQRGIDKKNSQENTAKSSIQKGKRGDLLSIGGSKQQELETWEVGANYKVEKLLGSGSYG